MRELDDAALELQLRRVLIARLGAVTLGLTAETLEQRRAARGQVRRRQRIVLGLGLAAAVALPAGWLAAGALVPSPPVPLVIVVVPTPSPVSSAKDAPPPPPASGLTLTTVEKLDRAPTGQLSAFGSTLLADGRVLLVGGADTTVGQQTVATAWLFDPATKRFTPTGAMSTTRAEPHAVTLDDGRVLVIGGRREDLTSNQQGSLSTAELYDPETGTFAPTAALPDERRDCPCGALGRLPWAIIHATLLRDGRVFLAGGDTSVTGGSATIADVFDPVTERWGQLNIGCDAARGAQALLPDGRLLIVCVDGQGGSPAPVDVRARLFDPRTNTFTEAAKPPAMDSVATTLRDGRVLLTGREPVVYDPQANAFRVLPDGPHPDAHTGIPLKFGRVLFLGATTLVFDPGSDTFTQGGQMGIANAYAVVPLHDGRILMVGYQLEAALLDPGQP